MGAFVGIGLIGAGLATGGAILGLDFRSPMNLKQRYRVALAAAGGPTLGLCFILIALLQELRYLGWNLYAFAAGFRALHAFLVAAVGAVSAGLFYREERPAEAVVGALVCCLVASPLTCWPLLLLSLL